jgi:hypothetical protein
MNGSDAQGDGLVLGEVEARADATDCAHPELAVRKVLQQLAVGLAGLLGAQRFEQVGIEVSLASGLPGCAST